jgi:predicted phage terminase large subunit-like protein
MAVTNYEKILREYDESCKRILKAAYFDIHETSDQKYKRIKHLEAEYTRWWEYYFPHYATCKTAPFQKKIADLVIKNKVIKLLNDAFRGSAKSVHAVIGIPLYLALVKKEVWFLLLIGQTEDKAIELLAGIQAELKINKRLINDYGEQFQHGDWAEGNFNTKDGVKFMALGFGQDPRGLRNGEHRPDYIVVDDVDTLKRCNNDRLIHEGIDYITGTLWGCFDKGNERFIFNNNLIHKNSLMGKLIELSVIANKQAEEQAISRTFYHIKTPAVLDDDFTPSWPEKYTAEYWREKRASTTYRSWMREYMCIPLVDGTIFKPEWIQYKKMLPLSKYDGLVLYGDLSYKDKGDYKALILAGKIRREFHVINAFVRQTSRALAACWLYDLYEKLKLEKYNISYLIEGLFAQDEFVNDFDMEGDRRGYYIPVVADKSTKGNKFDRIESMAGFFERLNVYFNESLKNSPDFTRLTDQLLAFEKGSGANDDGPDALQSDFAELNKVTFVEKFEIRTTPRTFNNRF